ncbi:adenosylmethionine decarboxylase [Chloroflexota bacterium]
MVNFARLGRHFICEFSGCKESILSNNSFIRDTFREAARGAGLSILSSGHAEFSPQGYSFYLLLEESHASIHVWPELCYVATDLYTCNLHIDANGFFKSLQKAYGAIHASIQVTERGCFIDFNDSVKQLVNFTLFQTLMTNSGLPSNKDPWGWHLIINMYKCDPNLIRSYDAIKKYIENVTEMIDVKRFGEPIIVNFGDNSEVMGFSMFQLIESSNLSGHFSIKSNRAYLDIFSCKEFDPLKALEFSIASFEANSATGRFIHRD